jgi:hypothetical protein
LSYQMWQAMLNLRTEMSYHLLSMVSYYFGKAIL